jgi:hypothetical protein
MQIAMKNWVFFALLCWSITACKNEKRPTDQPTASAPELKATPATATKPEIELLMVNVDNLLLRDQPTKNGSKAITKLSLGDFLEGTGEVSSAKEEATLREMVFVEPYLRVVTTTPEQHRGWAFGGGLTKVYAGSRANSPDLGRLSQFSAMLKGLSTKKTTSGKAAWDYVEANFKDAKGPLAEAVYVMLEAHLRRVIFESDAYVLTEKINWSEDDFNRVYENNFDMKKYPATATLATQGFNLETGEGMIFPIVDWQRMFQYFSEKVGPAFKQYLDLNNIEHKNFRRIGAAQCQLGKIQCGQSLLYQQLRNQGVREMGSPDAHQWQRRHIYVRLRDPDGHC